MGLFRNDTTGGTIDNYSTLVRPALDQRSMNQQFNMDIYGLERNARLQNAALQQMNRCNNSRAPQSIGTPQFYMNYGGYYPRLTHSRQCSPGLRAVARFSHCGRITSESMYFRSDLTTLLKCSRSTGLMR